MEIIDKEAKTKRFEYISFKNNLKYKSIIFFIINVIKNFLKKIIIIIYKI